MNSNRNTRPALIARASVIAWLAIALAGCGSGDHGPAIEARAQSITVTSVPSLDLGGTCTVAAAASSGLAVSYSSITSGICSVDRTSGLVAALAPGTCIVAVDQSGNSSYAPAPQVTLNLAVNFDPSQSITFDPPPALTFGGTASVSAVATSGLPVTYTSATPGVCTVDSSGGLVTDVTAGTCTIVANQSGDANYQAAPAVAVNLIVAPTVVVTVPGTPAGVTATLGTAGNMVTISLGAIDSGGSPVTSYTATSLPSGLTATSASLPITITCPSSCTGYAFSVTATNGVGDSSPSALTEVITRYNVVATFYEPDTQPRDSIFRGSFTFNSTTATVSELTGLLTESMTGDPNGIPPDYGMTELDLQYQLSSLTDGQGGLLVTTFLNNNTRTFWTNGGSNDGWSPEAGVAVGGIYYGFPGANPGNAYARIYVNTANPVSALTQTQIDKLAYADCAPGGMMGAACMTGTTTAGYGGIGTMSGYPVTQTISKQ